MFQYISSTTIATVITAGFVKLPFMFKLRLYQSLPYSCPYIPDNTAHHYTTDPDLAINSEIYSQLINLGFRRAGARVSRPNCTHCQQCISLRIPTTQFLPTRSQRRILRNNSDLTVKLVEQPVHSHYYSLYLDYINARHPEADSMQDVQDTFEHFFFSRWSDTFALEFRLPTNQLICVAICDPLAHGWSAVYTFYDADYNQRSLGSYSILSQIELLKQRQLDYLYLGYWIRDCAKMNYKTQFTPCEGYYDEQWKPITTP